MHDSSKKAINNGNKHIINIYWMAKKNIYSNLYLKTYRNSALIFIFQLDCERGFTKQNIIKCNAMENDTLHILMMVGLEGTDLFGYDFSDALSKIFQSKNRRIK